MGSCARSDAAGASNISVVSAAAVSVERRIVISGCLI
jgi:hypothetical protein